MQTPVILRAGLVDAAGTQLLPAVALHADAASASQQAAWQLIEEMYVQLIRRYGSSQHDEIVHALERYQADAYGTSAEQDELRHLLNSYKK